MVLPGLLLHRSLECWRTFNPKVPEVAGWRAVELGRCISDLSRSGGEEIQDFLNEIAQAVAETRRAFHLGQEAG